MPISSRIYHRGSIKLPDNPIVDIMILNLKNDYCKIGECELIENERGIFINNIKYGVDKEYLDNIINISSIRYLKEEGVNISKELTLGCMGPLKDVYKIENEAEFKFIYRQIFEDFDIKEIVRDIKLKSLF